MKKNILQILTKRALMAHITMCFIALQSTSLMSATPAQSPLLNRPARPVTPNVFFTFDDSGSMSFGHTPDTIGDVFFSRFNNNFYYPVATPEDVDFFRAQRICVVPTHTSGGALYTQTTGLDYVRYRSSADNTSYYNPAIYYRPWAKPDGTDFPLVSANNASAVPIDPLNQILASSNGLVTAVRSTAGANLTRTTANPRTTGIFWCRLAALPNNTPTNTNPAATDDNSRPFFPALYYTKNGNNYTAININTGTNFTKYPARTDCLGTTCTRPEELANFANWYTYYRKRNFLAIASASRAFGQQRSDIRLGYGRINNHAFQGGNPNNPVSVDGAPGTVLRGVRDFSIGTPTRNAFFSALYTMPATGGTPLRQSMDQVGQYFSVRGDIGPWSSSPGTGSTTNITTTQLACRKSYHLLMTDGLWNQNQATTPAARLDVDSQTNLPTITEPSTGQTYTYNPNTAAIYRDGWPNTLADVAMYYWATDLHNSLANKVPPTNGSNATTDRGDHAFWQNLTTYTVSLGVTGSITDRSVIPPPGGWPRPPNAADVQGGQESSTMVDDLWHAAINGRGKFVLANDSQDFESALQAFLQSIQEATDLSTGSDVGSTINIANSGNKRFVSEYNSGYWSGDVKAYNISNQGATGTQPVWSANAQMPNNALRNIFAWDPNSSTAIEFKNGVLPAPLRVASLWGGTAPADTLIDFLRGDRSLEGISYRCRGNFGRTSRTPDCQVTINEGKGKLGDIVNSTPLYIGKTSVDLTYQYLPSSIAGGGSYRAHIAGKKSRGTTGVIFAGANDGMLHAFDESTGVEKFAFIPNAVFNKLYKLADRQYGTNSLPHEFFVDGSLSETDAYLSGAWTNMLLGSTGAGARSVFALKLNTANPGNLSGNNVAWEFNDNSASPEASKLGYVLQPIEAGPMKNGQWVAIFGNGTDSPNGGAHLFIVNLSTGQPIKVIQVGATTNNGLGGVALIRNADQVIVGAYAGDKTGKLWRFDLESTSTAQWVAGWGNKPIFDAGKSITAAPALVTHPKGGQVVVTGTGRLIYEDDPSTPTINEDDLIDLSVQTLFGIWDSTPIGSASSTGNVTIVKNQLVEQTFSSLTSSIPGDTRRYWSLSRNPIAWTDPTSPKKGWFINLNLAAGQRHVFPAKNLLGIGYVPTIAPLGSTDGCTTTSAKQYNILLDLVTGQGFNKVTIDIGNSSSVGGYETIPSAKDESTFNVPCQGNSCLRLGGRDPSNTPTRFIQRNWVELIPR